MQETQEMQVWSLGWEDLPGEEMATHSNILAWRIPMDRGALRAAVHGVTKSRTQLSDWAQNSTSFTAVPPRKPIESAMRFVKTLGPAYRDSDS